MVDDMVVVRSDLREARLGLKEFSCELGRVVAYLTYLHTHVAVLLDCHAYLTTPIARREVAGEGLPAAIKQIVARVPVKRFSCALPMQGCR